MNFDASDYLSLKSVIFFTQVLYFFPLYSDGGNLLFLYLYNRGQRKTSFFQLFIKNAKRHASQIFCVRL